VEKAYHPSLGTRRIDRRDLRGLILAGEPAESPAGAPDYKSDEKHFANIFFAPRRRMIPLECRTWARFGRRRTSPCFMNLGKLEQPIGIPYQVSRSSSRAAPLSWQFGPSTGRPRTRASRPLLAPGMSESGQRHPKIAQCQAQANPRIGVTPSQQRAWIDHTADS
jgi:hypothetical protein